jgi:hypothetical protein
METIFFPMGSTLALREGTALVEGTPTDAGELRRELRGASKELKVRARLRGWSSALQQLPKKNIHGFKWLLLVLNTSTSTSTLNVTGYADRQQADKAIATLERSRQPDLDAVLVWVRSVNDLRAAYPNYYADTGSFLEALGAALK